MHPLVAQLTAVNSRLAARDAVRKRVVRDASQQITEVVETRDPPLDLTAIARDANATLAQIHAATDMGADDRLLAAAALVDFADLLAPLITDPDSRANLEAARAANQAWLDAAGVRVDPR